MMCPKTYPFVYILDTAHILPGSWAFRNTLFCFNLNHSADPRVPRHIACCQVARCNSCLFCGCPYQQFSVLHWYVPRVAVARQLTSRPDQCLIELKGFVSQLLPSTQKATS
jgi:hypothetical protein